MADEVKTSQDAPATPASRAPAPLPPAPLPPAPLPPAVPDDPPTGKRPKEIGGPAGPEPTRYGDWERKGRCLDF